MQSASPITNAVNMPTHCSAATGRMSGSSSVISFKSLVIGACLGAGVATGIYMYNDSKKRKCVSNECSIKWSKLNTEDFITLPEATVVDAPFKSNITACPLIITDETQTVTTSDIVDHLDNLEQAEVVTKIDAEPVNNSLPSEAPMSSSLLARVVEQAGEDARHIIATVNQ